MLSMNHDNHTISSVLLQHVASKVVIVFSVSKNYKYKQIVYITADSGSVLAVTEPASHWFCVAAPGSDWFCGGREGDCCINNLQSCQLAPPPSKKTF